VCAARLPHLKLKKIKNLPDAEPSLVTFIYGPVNSGKPALINHLIEQLPDDFCCLSHKLPVPIISYTTIYNITGSFI